jgi:hypothetical protein
LFKGEQLMSAYNVIIKGFIVFFIILQVMFKAYDTNHDGGLSPTEVYDLIKAAHYSKGVVIPHDQVKILVEN